ncbi:MAG: 4-hydroxy-3-methylbut-2-enyl diphosphate reductase [Clostridiales bacterium]|uniref:4-hydroxy-3-methylbut-2-enyl diphosphate reductase n=1 Tax=Clostridium sp. N3C TaxID=1776758 RepID=UPI00092DFE18|nr:4-hydroxy-3-methylbut-2-enyl diphosphate reductase [Clostridium sp. N3C]NLZ49433.1 4-hydroxy-3-methylbut-2-enyl diphosphate reductase [Clostridiales bacterium]SCN25177.1 4-hydroxy-3-methylbut-2-enyl diphosphate reductase [Clostridium sp. N3C]
MFKEVILAENAGFCFGVKRAVDTSMDAKKDSKENIYTFGPLVHNKNVIDKLSEEGIYVVNEDDLQKVGNGDTIVIRSHGVAPQLMKKIQDTGAQVIDATCPFVTAIHKNVKKYYDLGYQIVIVGDEKHPEVIGSNGWCDNTAVITRDGSEVEKLADKVCIVAQTTEKLSNLEKVKEAITKQCKEVVTFNTICSATKERQTSAEETSKKVDVMLVVGSKTSSNTTKLYEICKKNCENTYFIDNSNEIPQWIMEDEKVKKVGVTAGASTPDWIIQDVLDKLYSNIEK